MLRSLRALTLDAWEDLLRDYPPDPNPSRRVVYQVLGLYLVAGLVLAVNRYAAWKSFGWLPEAWTDGLPKPAIRIWWAWMLVIMYLGPPYLYMRLVLREGWSDFGFSAKGLWQHLPLYFLFFAIVFPLVVVFSGTEHFLETYPLAKWASLSWGTLIAWEISYALQFVALEFFFRGFLVFGPARILGAWVVPVMGMSYLMLHFQKPFLESMGSIFAGFALGVVALRTRSIYAGMLIHIAVAWSMDLLAMHHKGELARLVVGGG